MVLSKTTAFEANSGGIRYVIWNCYLEKSETRFPFPYFACKELNIFLVLLELCHPLISSWFTIVHFVNGTIEIILCTAQAVVCLGVLQLYNNPQIFSTLNVWHVYMACNTWHVWQIHLRRCICVICSNSWVQVCIWSFSRVFLKLVQKVTGLLYIFKICC